MLPALLNNAAFILLYLIQMIKECIKTTLNAAVVLKDNPSQFLHKGSPRRTADLQRDRKKHTSLLSLERRNRLTRYHGNLSLKLSAPIEIIDELQIFSGLAL